MNRKMVCAFIILICLLFSTAAIYLPSSTQAASAQIEVPKSTVLINNFQGKYFSMRLFYGDLSQELITAYDLSNYNLSNAPENYTTYTNGIIENDKYNFVINAINQYHLQNNLDTITHIDYYTEQKPYAFVGLTHGLNSFYRIHLTTGEINMYLNNDQSDIEYIYHFTQGTDAYYALTYNRNSNMAHLYTLHLEDFTLLQSQSIVLPKPITQAKQCALDPNGTAYFILDDKLLLVTQDGNEHLNLSFTPDYVFFEEQQLYIISVSDFFLKYTVFNKSLEVLYDSQANLPNNKVTLQDCYLSQNYLYTLCQDNNHPLFSNYVTIYNMANHQMLYCIGMRDTLSYPLLASQLISAYKKE